MRGSVVNRKSCPLRAHHVGNLPWNYHNILYSPIGDFSICNGTILGVPLQIAFSGRDHLRLSDTDELDHYVWMPCTCEVQWTGAIRMQTEKLALAYAVGKLQAGDRCGCTAEWLKTLHRSTFWFDRAMVLFNDVVEIFTTAHLYVFPVDVFFSDRKSVV